VNRDFYRFGIGTESSALSETEMGLRGPVASASINASVEGAEPVL